MNPCGKVDGAVGICFKPVLQVKQDGNTTKRGNGLGPTWTKEDGKNVLSLCCR